MNIGITCRFSYSFNANGLNQNIVLLYEALELCGYDVFFLDYSDKDHKMNPHPFIDNKKIIPWAEYRDSYNKKVDIVFCPGISANKELKDCTKLKNPKSKIVAVHYGNNLLSDIHEMLFKEEKRFYLMSPECNVDHIVYSPHYKLAKQYYECIERAPSSEIPYIWDPKFIELDAETRGYSLGYKHSEKPNIAVAEPNLNISKTCFLPIITILKLLEENPDKINNAAIFANIFHDEKVDMSKVKYWLANQTVIKKHPQRVFFDPRRAFSYILKEDNPIIFSHQFYNSLNYIYLEAMYFGHPLVHNSPEFKTYGYYYEKFNIIDAKSCILNAVENFQKDELLHKKAAKQLIRKYSIEENIKSINEMIERINNA